MKNNDLLPIGSVVFVENGTKQLIIVGYGFKNESGKMFDYIGFLYPEGFLSKKINYLFNRENIREVTFKGFINEQFDIAKRNMDKVLENKSEGEQYG